MPSDVTRSGLELCRQVENFADTWTEANQHQLAHLFEVLRDLSRAHREQLQEHIREEVLRGD